MSPVDALLSSQPVKVFRKMLPFLIIIAIFLVVGAAMVTNPIKARSLIIEAEADPERLEAWRAKFPAWKDGKRWDTGGHCDR